MEGNRIDYSYLKVRLKTAFCRINISQWQMLVEYLANEGFSEMIDIITV